jgi:hypothetical protein
MKPFRIFIFGLSVFIFLFLLSVLLSDKALQIFGIRVKIPSFGSLANSSKPQYKDISHILQLSHVVVDSVVTAEIDTIHTPGIKPDKAHQKTYKPASSDSIRSVLRSMEFPPNADTLLFPFFGEMCRLPDSKQLIRILHYGDSQIEGDRITSYIRNQLQLKFGGGGIGMLPVVAVNPTSLSYVYNVSDNWVRHSPLIPSDQAIKRRRYGALLSFSRFGMGTSLFGKSKECEGSIELQRSNIAYPLSQRFQQCRIFYGYNKSSMMVEIKQHKTVLDADIVPASSSLKELQWDIASARDFTISFKTNDSPDVYGIALDAYQGIAVDNIPLRGSSGLEFTKMDLTFLKEFYHMLNVKLLILQFGVNIVPNVTQNYDYYGRNFMRQLTALRQIMPNLPIIVIGVSDISRNGENGYESYPNVEMIRNVQKKAAFDTGCAFWDIYEAMGGHNSMPSWVYANPPLAQKDFIHFSPLGAKIIGEMFYRSFMLEYGRYLKTRAVSL